MAKLIIGIMTLTSVSAFAIDCTTADGVRIKTRPLYAEFGQLVETSTGISAKSYVTNGNEVVSFESADGKTISFFFVKLELVQR
jgi:hypothetical protein